jgi:hypothetical protein
VVRRTPGIVRLSGLATPKPIDQGVMTLSIMVTMPGATRPLRRRERLSGGATLGGSKASGLRYQRPHTPRWRASYPGCQGEPRQFTATASGAGSQRGSRPLCTCVDHGSCSQCSTCGRGSGSARLTKRRVRA